MLDQTYTISAATWPLRVWRVEKQGDTDIHLVINDSTGEQHTALSYRSAFFLQNMFNDQHNWYNYERHSTTITYSSDSRLMWATQPSSVIGSLPKANWRYCFGDSKDTYFQFYLKKAPNAFQRWMYYKILGIRWEKVN